MAIHFRCVRAALLGAMTLLMIAAQPVLAQETYRVVGVAPGDWLNVRAGPARSFPVVGRLERDATGIRRSGECRDNWCRVSHGAVRGWVNSRFLAVEEEEATAEVETSTPGVVRSVLPDGTLELRFPDGTARRRLPDGNMEIVRPDGTTSKFTYLQAPGADLPPLPSEYADWGTRLNNDLLRILTNILTPEELIAYQQTEQGKSFYEVTNWRLLSIQFLTAPTS